MTLRSIKDISDFIFVSDKLNSADVILIPGSSKWEISEKAALLYQNQLSHLIVCSGKYSSKLGHFANDRVVGSFYDGVYETDSEFCRHVLTINDVLDKDILCETESTNTYENALFSQNLLEKQGHRISSAIICCQAFHARRVLMTYEHVFPSANIMIAPTDTKGITKDNWFTNENGVKIVMDELEKLGKYFRRYYSDTLCL